MRSSEQRFVRKQRTSLQSVVFLRVQTTKKTKVAVPGTRTVQPPPKWEMKCDWVTDMIPQCRVKRSSLQHVLHFCFFSSDRVQAGRVHGPGSQVRARPGREVLQIRSAQVESGKKCSSRTNSKNQHDGRHYPDQAADERDGVVPDKRLHNCDKEQDTLRRGPHPDRLPRTDGIQSLRRIFQTGLLLLR